MGISICPECRAGKHVNCDGQAWDSEKDEPTVCACSHEVVKHNGPYPEETLGEDYDDGTITANVADLAEAVVGHRIVNFEKDIPLPPGQKPHWSWGRAVGHRITLDNDMQVWLIDTDDCCAYTALGDFLLHADKIDHIITGVGTTDGYTKWHIFADFGDVLELGVGWSCGNPFYYGYGFDIRVLAVVPGEVVMKEITRG